jgi:uncharacterized protein YaiI (UPF0178 family)
MIYNDNVKNIKEDLYYNAEQLQAYFQEAILNNDLEIGREVAIAYELIYRVIKVLAHRSELYTHDIDYAYDKLSIAYDVLSQNEEGKFRSSKQLRPWEEEI